MDGKKLTRMANQIAAFFAADPDQTAAVENVTGHLRRFWEPRMRADLLAWFDRGGDHGLHPLVVSALQKNRQTLQPAN